MGRPMEGRAPRRLIAYSNPFAKISEPAVHWF
mgnify:CR=1 FL=1